MVPLCRCCGKEMKFVGLSKLPAYDYCEDIFVKFECECQSCTTYLPSEKKED